MGWVMNVTFRPLYPREKTRYPLYRRLGGPRGRSGQVRKIVPTGIRSEDLPARSDIYIPKRVVQQHKGTDLRVRLENQPTWNVIVMFIGPCIIVITAESINQLDVTRYFIVLLIGSTCFRHYYVHHQELNSNLEQTKNDTTNVVNNIIVASS